MNLNQGESRELKHLYTKLNALYKEKAKIEVLKKNRENTLKEEIASVCEIKNKQGEIQANKVKMPLVCAILDELYKELPNKETIKADTMQSYKKAIVSKEVNEECIKGYVQTQISLKENAENIKEVYKESSLLPKEILDALSAFLKDEYKLLLNDELARQGYEVKEDKDKGELLELKEIIRDLVK